MLEVSIKIDGDVERKLKAIEGELVDYSSELREVGTYLTDFIQGPVFDTEGAVFGQPWAVLSTLYDIEKRKEYGGRGILERTGAMRRSFTWTSDATQGDLTNPTPYLQYHQTGTRKMPKRVVYYLDEERKNKIGEIFHDQIARRVERAANS